MTISDLNVFRAIKTSRTENHVFAEDAYCVHAHNNKLIQMASGQVHDTLYDVFPPPVCCGAHLTKSQLFNAK